MAKLLVLPEQAVISGYKGTVDFYVHDGVPCARSWPRSPGKRRAPAVEAQWPLFTFASREWDNLTPIVKLAYDAMAMAAGLSGRDLQMRGYLRGLYRYSLE